MIADYAVYYDEEQALFQIRTRSDIFLLEFDDPEKREIFEALVAKLKKNSDITYEQWVKGVEKKHDSVKVLDVVTSLKDNDLLPYELAFEVPVVEGAENNIQDAYGAPQGERSFSCEIRQLGIIGQSPWLMLWKTRH